MLQWVPVPFPPERSGLCLAAGTSVPKHHPKRVSSCAGHCERVFDNLGPAGELVSALGKHSKRHAASDHAFPLADGDDGTIVANGQLGTLDGRQVRKFARLRSVNGGAPTCDLTSLAFSGRIDDQLTV